MGTGFEYPVHRRGNKKGKHVYKKFRLAQGKWQLIQRHHFTPSRLTSWESVAASDLRMRDETPTRDPALPCCGGGGAHLCRWRHSRPTSSNAASRDFLLTRAERCSGVLAADPARMTHTAYLSIQRKTVWRLWVVRTGPAVGPVKP